jgi:hypothetical protein
MNSKLQVQEYQFSEKVPSLDIKILNEKKVLQKQAREDDASSMTMIKDIQKIIEKCADLSTQEKLDFCKSQRYFIKEYLKNLNRKHNI